MKISERELHEMFMVYLDIALGEFEQPHNLTDTKRLDVYRRAFRKVVMDKFEEQLHNMLEDDPCGSANTHSSFLADGDTYCKKCGRKLSDVIKKDEVCQE